MEKYCRNVFPRARTRMKDSVDCLLLSARRKRNDGKCGERPANVRMRRNDKILTNAEPEPQPHNNNIISERLAAGLMVLGSERRGNRNSKRTNEEFTANNNTHLKMGKIP